MAALQSLHSSTRPSTMRPLVRSEAPLAAEGFSSKRRRARGLMLVVAAGGRFREVRTRARLHSLLLSDCLSCFCTALHPAMSTTTGTTTAVEDEYTLLLRSRLGDEQTMNRASESFESVFQQEHVRSQTLRDIRQLRQTVNDIDRGFQLIRNDLWTFDQQGFHDENGQILQLAPRWTAHYDVRPPHVHPVTVSVHAHIPYSASSISWSRAIGTQWMLRHSWNVSAVFC